jgi:hypothetical protein
MSDENQAWTGESGFNYLFYIYDLEPDAPSRLGIYIYAKKNAEGLWKPVYIGYGEIPLCAGNDAALMARILEKGATNVHLRLNTNPVDGRHEAADLLKRYVNALEPHGCNVPDPNQAPAQPPIAVAASDGQPQQEVGAAAPAQEEAGKSEGKKSDAKKGESKKSPARRGAPDWTIAVNEDVAAK